MMAKLMATILASLVMITGFVIWAYILGFLVRGAIEVWRIF